MDMPPPVTEAPGAPTASVPIAPSLAPAWSRPAVMLPLLAVFAVVAAWFPSFSTESTVMILISGGLLFWLGFSPVVPRQPSPRRLDSVALWWLVPTGALLVVEAINFGLGSTYDHPTLSKLTDPVLQRYPAKAAMYFAWLTSFWGMVRR